MRLYAHIVDGVVRELVPGVVCGMPLEDRYSPAFVGQCVDITGLAVQPEPGWLYVDGVGFAAPLFSGG